MARSKSSIPQDEPLFPNLKFSGVDATLSPNFSKDVNPTANPTACAAPPSYDDHKLLPSYLGDECPPSYFGHDPNNTPTGPFNPVNKLHDKWMPISIHTAKCDNCSKHNTSVIQRCASCSFQLCRNCIGSVDDKIHSADVVSLVWTPKVQPRGKRGSTAARKLTSKAPAASMTLSNNRVKKPAFRGSTRIPSKRLPTEAQKQNTILDDGGEDIIHVGVRKGQHLDKMETDDVKRERRYPSDDEYEDEGPKAKRSQCAIDPAHVNDDEDTDEDEIVEQRIRFHQDQQRPRDPVEVRMVERTTAWQKIEDAALDNNYGKGKGRAKSAKHTPSPYAQRPHKHPAALGSAPPLSPHPSQSGRKAGFSFDDAIAQAYEQRQNSKLQAEQRRLEAEQDAAWKNNSTIKKLLDEGKEEEAREMMGAATELLMVERGMHQGQSWNTFR